MNIETLNWVPTGDVEGNFNTHSAAHAGRGFIISLHIDTRRAELTLFDCELWWESKKTNHWPMLDRVFGRKNWQQFIADWEATTVKELEANS